MMDKLRNWYAGLSEREQRIVAVGSVILGLLLVVGGLLLPMHAAVTHAIQRSETRVADLEWMRGNTAEIRMGAMTLPRDTNEAPVVLVDRVARENGLGNAFRGTQPSAGGHGVRVQLEAAPFDTMITWLGALEQRYGLTIETVTVERTAKPGIVNASITLTQTK
jgi:general secretion pathway protein M